MNTNAIKSNWVPISEADHRAVRDQLERILGSPLFQHSRHYQDFLRYVVEKTLEGQAGTLKERTLGIDVFGRDPLYDPKLDNTVRSTSTRVRKRLAEYYQDRERATELLIELPAGAYVPVFSPPHEEPPLVLASEAPEKPNLPVPVRKSRKWIVRCCAFFIVLTLVGAVNRWNYPRHEVAIKQFWKPALTDSGSITICMGSNNPETTPSTIPFNAAEALANLTGFFGATGRAYHIRRDASTTFADLKDGSIVLIGAFSNKWSLRFTSELRFSFQKDSADHVLWIQDRQNPSRRDWVSEYHSADQTGVDYGIISRLFDETTNQFIVVIAGLRKYGTVAAIHFLTDQRQIQSLSQVAPKGWEAKNLQLVFVTKVVDGVPGDLKIIAIHTW